MNFKFWSHLVEKVDSFKQMALDVGTASGFAIEVTKIADDADGKVFLQNIQVRRSIFLS